MKLPLRRLWLCAASVVLALGLLTLALSIVQGAGSLTRVTVASESGRWSAEPGLNADGTKIVFESNSDFLDQGIPNSQYEIWLYDTQTMTFTRITTASHFDRSSRFPSLSADGTKIAFESDSDFFNQGISRFQTEIWLYDTQTMTLTRVTTASSSDRKSDDPGISANGAKIAFVSDSDFFTQGIQRYQHEIWLYDTQTMTLTRVTTATPANRTSNEPSLNQDGTKLAFASDSDFFTQGIQRYQHEIWVYNTQAVTVTRITTAPDRIGSAAPSINADGTRIAFLSGADFFNQGNIQAPQSDIWLYDTATMTLTRVTTSSYNRSSIEPSISAAGTKIAFYGNADLLNQGIPDAQYEVWLYDTVTMTLTRITTATPSLRQSVDPIISANGTRIAFFGDSDFFSQGIPITQCEVWLFSESNQNEARYKIYLPLLLK